MLQIVRKNLGEVTLAPAFKDTLPAISKESEPLPVAVVSTTFVATPVVNLEELNGTRATTNWQQVDEHHSIEQLSDNTCPGELITFFYKEAFYVGVLAKADIQHPSIDNVSIVAPVSKGRKIAGKLYIADQDICGYTGEWVAKYTISKK